MPTDPPTEHGPPASSSPKATKSTPRRWPGFSISCDEQIVDQFSALCSACEVTRSEAVREFMRAAILKPAAFKLAIALSTQRDRPFGDQLADLLTAQLRILRENGEIK